MWETFFQRIMSSLWWLSLSIAIWLMRKSPTTLPPVRQHLLFSESEIEQALTSVLQLAHIRTSLNDSSMQSPGKFPFQTESHDDDEEWINEEEIEVPTYLHFYCTSEIPDCLAVVRFTLWDDLGVAAVTEEVYKDAPEEGLPTPEIEMDFEIEAPTTQQLQKLLWDEVTKYHPHLEQPQM